MKLFFFDLETTGTNRDIHGIHQISGKIFIDGVLKEVFDYKVQPAFGSIYDPKALEVCGVTEAQLKSYPHMHTVYPMVLSMLCKYIDMDDDNDRYFIAGYNCQIFDAGHFAKWFKLNNGLKYFKTLFWTTTLDVMILATAHLAHRRHIMENFKLKTVAKFLGIVIDESKLHTADYDTELTILVYNIVCNKY